MKKITFWGIIMLISLIVSPTKAEINFDLSTVGGSITLDYAAVSTEKAKAQTDRWITVANFAASGTSGKCGTATATFDIKSGRTIAFYLAKCDKMIINANIASGRGLTYTINDGTSTTLAGTGVCKDYEVAVNSESPVKIIVQGLNSSSAWTSFFTFTYAPKVPQITAFKINGTSTNIDQTAKTITLEMPYGTNLSAVTPDVTIASATGFTPTGAQNFSAGSVIYSVTDGTTTTNYTATITAKSTPDTEKSITSLTVNGRVATINETTGVITCEFPSFTGTLGNWPVVYTLNTTTGSANFISNNNYDFAANNTLTITVTAQDNSTKVYNVISSISTKKNIGLLCLNGKAETYDNLLLSAFSDYFVNFIYADATAPADIAAFYSNYDLLVFHANVSGTNATGLASKALIGVKPVLNLKAFFYNSGRWNWSTTAPGNAAAGVGAADVQTSLQNHPIFNNVTFSGTTLTYYDNLPSANTNAIQFASDLATMTGFTSQTIATSGTGIQIHESQNTPAAKYLMIGLSVENNNFTYFNTNAVNVLKNAAAYLLNPTAKYNYQVTSVNAASEKDPVYYNNNILYNNQMQKLEVFNMSGMRIQVSTEKTIDTSKLPQGAYIVKTNSNGVLKFIK
jgi:hypothetical protein